MEASRGDKLMRVRIETILPSPNQTRADFSDETLLSLADSIRNHGLIAPILLRAGREGYELIAGERRLRAVKLLGQTHIDALITNANGREAALLTLLENLQRKDLHFLEQAEALLRLQNAYGFSQTEMAEHLGLSQPAIANKLRLLTLPEKTRAAIRISNLSERHARALLKLPDVKAQLDVIRRAQTEGMSVSRLEALIARETTARPKPRSYRLLLRDHRLLVNAVLKTVRTLNAAGIKATSRVEERPDCIEVVVSLPINSPD